MLHVVFPIDNTRHLLDFYASSMRPSITAAMSERGAGSNPVAATSPKVRVSSEGREREASAERGVSSKGREREASSERGVPSSRVASHTQVLDAGDGDGSPRKRPCKTPRKYRRAFFDGTTKGLSLFGQALLKRNWTIAHRQERASLVWSHVTHEIDWDRLRCWQRPSHVRGESILSRKDYFLEGLRRNPEALRFLPESYELWNEDERDTFARILLREKARGVPLRRGADGHILNDADADPAYDDEYYDDADDEADETEDYEDEGEEGEEPNIREARPRLPAWLLKDPRRDAGKGITIIDGDPRPELLNPYGNPEAPGDAIREVHRDKIAQRYVRDLLLLDGHKFDLRMYWFVASIRPPIVFFHSGTLRVSLNRLDDANATSKGQHLTNAAQQEGGHDARRSSELSRKPMEALWDLLAREHPTHPHWPKDPRAHIHCGIREAIAQFWFIFEEHFQSRLQMADKERDSWSILGADFMLDTSLGLHVSELQSGPGLPTNTRAIKNLLDVIIPEMATIVTHLHEVTDRPKPRWPLPTTSWELLVNGTRIVPCGARERRRGRSERHGRRESH